MKKSKTLGLSIQHRGNLLFSNEGVHCPNNLQTISKVEI